MQIINLPRYGTIRYGALWNGMDTVTSGPGTLITEDGVITAVQQNKKHCTADLSNCTLMPALIDCHVHLAMPYENGSDAVTRAEDLLRAGIAAVRDGGSRQGAIFTSPQLQIANCGQAITKAGFYGNNLGTAVNNLSEALSLLNEMNKLGVTHIKLIASGIFSFSRYGETGAPPFNGQELHAIVRYAKQLGLAVMAHASGDEAVRSCITAGVDSIEHGYFMEAETLAELASKSIAWVPTLTPVAVQLQVPSLREALSPEQRQVIHRSLERQLAMVRLGETLGVRIGAGSDAGATGVAHGSSLHRELDLLYRAGMTSHRALQSATSTAAGICGFQQLGSIRTGNCGTLLAVKGNPLIRPPASLQPVALLLPHSNWTVRNTI